MPACAGSSNYNGLPGVCLRYAYGLPTVCLQFAYCVLAIPFSLLWRLAGRLVVWLAGWLPGRLAVRLLPWPAASALVFRVGVPWPRWRGSRRVCRDSLAGCLAGRLAGCLAGAACCRWLVPAGCCRLAPPGVGCRMMPAGCLQAAWSAACLAGCPPCGCPKGSGPGCRRGWGGASPPSAPSPP